MKKVIGIYCGDVIGDAWDENSLQEGIGGSETWVIYIASELQKKNFHVIIFNKTKDWHFAIDGVEYVPYSLFESRCQYQHFDYFITSRRTDEININLSCDNIYLMMHDLSLFEGSCFNKERIKKVVCLSNFQLNNTISIYPNEQLNKKYFSLTFNGVDPLLYKKNIKKENMMVWSSCRERGLPYFMFYIYPLIKNKIPDFKVVFADYNNIPYDDPRVEYYGKLSKSELAELQMRSKIWIYPPTFYETFCITAVENAMAKNAIVTVDIGAMSDTLNGYSGIFGNNYLDLNGEVDKKEYAITAKKIAELSISLLKDDKLRIKYANKAHNICKKYTWANAAQTWVDLFNS